MGVSKTRYEALVSKNSELTNEIQKLKERIRQLEETGDRSISDGQPLNITNTSVDYIYNQFQQIFETNQAIKLIINPENGKIVKANKSAVSFYGYPEKVLTSMYISDINILSDSEVMIEMEQALTEQRLFFNFRHKLASGEIRDVEVFSGPFQSGEKKLLLSIIHDVTQRIKTMEELRENEKLLRTIAENYPNSYLSIIEKDLTCGFSGGQEFKKQNLDPKAFTGLSLKEIFGEHEPFIRQQYKKTFAGEEQSFELFINNQHQHYRTIPLINEKGEINRILSVVENITERKESESALKKSKERLDLIIQGSQDAPWDWNFANREIYYSPQWWKQVGYTPNEIPVDDQLWHRLLHPEDVNRVDELLSEGLKTDIKSYEVEFRLKHKQGHYVPVLSRGIVTRDDDGNVTRLTGANMDLTEKKKAEAKLREAKETAERYLDMGGSMFVSLDIKGNIVLINQKGLEILGYSKNELLGKNWFDTCIPDGLKDEMKKVFTKIVNGDLAGVEKYENAVYTKSGELKTIAWYNSYLIGKTGKIEYLFSSGNDITDIKKAQSDLMESRTRYHNFVKNSSEGIYRIEMIEPVPIDLPENELIEKLNQNSVVAEVNVALAEMYGLKSEDMVGKPAVNFAPEYGKRAKLVIQNKNHHARDIQTQDIDKYGNAIHLSETYHGEIEDGKLVRIWGVQRNITDFLKVQNELINSQERFNQAMMASKDGIFDWNLLTNEIYYSPGWKSMLGYEYDELPNDFSVWETLTEPDDVKKSWEMQQQCINKQLDRFEMEFKMRHKDGHWVDILSRAKAIFDENGKAIRFVGTHVDISERKQWEKKLMENEDRFRKMIEYMPNGVLILKPTNDGSDFEFVEVNNHAEKLTKMAKHEIIGATMTDKLANITKSPLFKGLKQVNETGEELFIPPFFYKDEVREGWREAYLYKIQSGDIVLIVKDVTDIQKASQKLKDQNAELKSAKEKAEESETRFKALHNASFGGITIHDKGIILDCNQGLSEITGYSSDELIGMDGLLLIAEHSRSMVMNNILLQYELPYEAFGVRKNGEEYPLRLEARMIPYKGKTVRVVEFRDITDQKQTEAELRKAKEKAEESDRLKSAFLANMSHEIRTPMNGILGFADLLKEPGLSGEALLKYIAIIERSGERMLNIINDLIDISKIEAGQMEVKFSETNIRDQAEYLCTFFKPEMEKKGLNLITHFQIKDAPLSFWTDREKLYAIITNLLKNAIKYTNEGSIEFGYHFYKDTKSAEMPDGASLATGDNHKASLPHRLMLQIYVKDTGIGIPQDRLDAVFERFVQADIEDKKAMEGAGLGLAISKAYVEMMGGEIWVESNEGEGSTFYFTIQDKSDEKQKFHEKKLKAQSKADFKTKALKILVAEDDETSKAHLSIVLKNIASEIIYAHNGIEAVELCRQHQDIDLVLMDIKMPELNGYDATREIRKFNKDIVIIAQTAYALSGDNEKAIEAGCNDYISKPLNKEELVVLIQKNLHK